MWWQDHLAAFRAMSMERSLLVLALAMLIDAATGFTRWFSKVLKMENQRDAVLLSLILLLEMLITALALFGTHWSMTLENAFEFAKNAQQKAEFARQVWYFHLDTWLIQSVAIASAVGCTILARRQGRSVPVWLVLGYFGSLGSIIWLLAACGYGRWRQALIAGAAIAGVALPLYL